MTDTPTGSNYLTVAIQDDLAAEQNESEQVDVNPKASAREARIAAAIERSKTEYQPQHAYTERKWFLDTDDKSRSIEGKVKVDRQKVEYFSTSLYRSGDFRKALEEILAVFEPSQPLGGLSRELVDTGSRCALEKKDLDTAMKLVETTKAFWKQTVGTAAVAADVYLAAGKPYESLEPTITSSASGLHVPVLERFDQALAIINPNGFTSLRTLIRQYNLHRRAAFQGSLFNREDESLDPLDKAKQEVESFTEVSNDELQSEISSLRLSQSLASQMEHVLRRLQRGRVDIEEIKERTVREL